ncbi:MAG TPA: phage tail assembly chaperone [Sphingopyxis sp.]|nr:phage tail assembly chaperone [Sphingopyxis sp.]HMP46768.1 phage tail assembly chaperone [Sphingopyxis sp.]HMQ19899.1 phage tail assembly chaperone [Sphingopyxis sp.]
MFGTSALRLAGLMARVAGWPPDIFWNATPADAAAVLGGWVEEEGADGVDRHALAAMMEHFPDD